MRQPLFLLFGGVGQGEYRDEVPTVWNIENFVHRTPGSGQKKRLLSSMVLLHSLTRKADMVHAAR